MERVRIRGGQKEETGGRPSRAYQDRLPEQQQDFLHGEVGGVHAAELGHHGEEEQGEGLAVVQRGC